MDPSLEGVLDVVDTEVADLHIKAAPVQTETKTEAPKTETKTETKTENKQVEAEAEPDDAENQDSQDFSRTPVDETETEEEAPAETEPSKTQTQTENKTVEEAPKADEFEPKFDNEPTFNLEAPKYDEDGYITNMTPQQYENYVIARAQYQMRHEAWVTGNESKALDAAEKILPEIKSSPAVRQMVENARVASILNGSQINSYEAAKLVKEALGLSNVEQKVAAAKAEGVAEGTKNAKVSITIQKNAAVETPSPKKRTTDPKQAALTKRLKAGDDSAFEDLLTQWDKDGKL